MTTGQIVFFAGVGLLALTVILAIIFLIKKPKYTPSKATYDGSYGGTQKLHNGYPTDRLTILREEPKKLDSGTVLLPPETEKISDGTVLLTDDEATEQAVERTVLLSPETVLLQEEDDTVLLQENTAPLSESTEKL